MQAACHLGRQIVSALERQSVTVTGTDAAAVVLPHLARRLSPCTPSGLMSPRRPVTLLQIHPHVPGPDLQAPEPTHLTSYAGLAPVTRRSSSSIRGEHVSHGGIKGLKYGLPPPLPSCTPPPSAEPTTTANATKAGRLGPGRPLPGPPPLDTPHRGTPNRRYIGDIPPLSGRYPSYLPLADGRSLYLATVIDCYSRRLIGWALRDHMRTPLVIEALQQAAVTRGSLKGAVFHTDHGSVYTSKAFATEYKKLDVTQSMGAIGSSTDNALAESMGATLKREILMDARSWDDELTCRRQTFRWLNRARHHAPPLLLRPPTPIHLRETDLDYHVSSSTPQKGL